MIKNYDINAEDIRRLRALSQLPDEDFTRLLSAVLPALGASEKQASVMISNHNAIRNMIRSASDSDIKKLSRRLGPKQTAEILCMIDSAFEKNKET